MQLFILKQIQCMQLIVLQNILQRGEKNGYMTTKKEAIKNLELIKNIDYLMNDINVTFEHVYSHKGEYYNELAEKSLIL